MKSRTLISIFYFVLCLIFNADSSPVAGTLLKVVDNKFFSSGHQTPVIPMKKAPRIIIAGPPASGKGTQCELIKNLFGVVHLSTGDILRTAVADNTDLGLKAQTYMDNGQLVPDDLITGLVKDKLNDDKCSSTGWLLDGFPRTKEQAFSLIRADMVPDIVILLDVPDHVLIERVVGRKTDPITGKIYHMTFSPPTDPAVMNRLVQRSDDTIEKVTTRISEFKKHITAIKSYFEDRLIIIDGTGSPAAISQQIVAVIEASNKMQSASRVLSYQN